MFMYNLGLKARYHQFPLQSRAKQETAANIEHFLRDEIYQSKTSWVCKTILTAMWLRSHVHFLFGFFHRSKTLTYW